MNRDGITKFDEVVRPRNRSWMMDPEGLKRQRYLLIRMTICHVAQIAPGSPIPIAAFSPIDNPPPPPPPDPLPPKTLLRLAEVELAVGTEVTAVGAKVSAVGPVVVAIFTLIDNPPPPTPPDPLPPETSPAEVELAVGTEATAVRANKVGAVGPVGVASNSPQNPFTIDVAAVMSAWEVLHPVAATEEAAETAEAN